jgi:hypothetical protein
MLIGPATCQDRFIIISIQVSVDTNTPFFRIGEIGVHNRLTWTDSIAAFDLHATMLKEKLHHVYLDLDSKRYITKRDRQKLESIALSISSIPKSTHGQEHLSMRA